MKTNKIITHAGRAHRDDFLAVCWLLGSLGSGVAAEVHRREPTAVELDDDEVWVIDIGMRHEPALRNFDHHQRPADATPTCAVQLLLEHDLGEEAHDIFPWLWLTGLIDSKGAAVAAAHYGAPLELFTKLASPIELGMLELFGSASSLNQNDTLFRTMMAIGRTMWERAMSLGEAQRTVACSMLESNGIQIMIADPDTVTGMPSPHFLPEVMELKRRAFEAAGWKPQVSISPNVDSRGPGWVLYRYDDAKRIDFSRIKDAPLVTFAHSNGFIAKVVKEATMVELVALVQQADKTPTPQ